MSDLSEMLEQAQRETREKEEAASRLRQDPEPLHRDKLGGSGTLRSQMSISDIERVPEHNPRHDELDYAGITETNIEQLGMAAYYKATGRGQPPRRVLKADYAEGWRTWVKEQINQIGAHRFGDATGAEQWRSLLQLATSIYIEGVTQPIGLDVGPSDETRLLIYGNRRLLASKLVAMEMIPALCYRGIESDEDKNRIRFTENQHTQVSPTSIIHYFRQQHDPDDISINKVQRLIQWSRWTAQVIAAAAKLPADDYSVLHPIWQRTNPTFRQINITLQTRREKGMVVAIARLDDSPKPEIQSTTESGTQAGQGGHDPEPDAPDKPTQAEQSSTPPSEPPAGEGATASREPLGATPPETSASSNAGAASQPESAPAVQDRAGQTDHSDGAQEASPPPAPEQHDDADGQTPPDSPHQHDPAAPPQKLTTGPIELHVAQSLVRIMQRAVADPEDPVCPPDMGAIENTLTRAQVPVENWTHRQIGNYIRRWVTHDAWQGKAAAAPADDTATATSDQTMEPAVPPIE